MGLPVLAGFSGGAGILLGSRGGYILGFLLIALVMWAAEKLPGDPRVTLICSMAVGLALCYAFGTVWFMALYTKSHGPVALGTVLGWCVFPFLLPDAAKIAGAAVLIRRLKRHIR